MAGCRSVFHITENKRLGPPTSKENITQTLDFLKPPEREVAIRAGRQCNFLGGDGPSHICH